MITTKKRISMALAALAIVGVGAAVKPAQADPMQLNAFVGVGSDTIQDVFNAFTGYTNGVDYTPLHATSGKQIISFDAVDPTPAASVCIKATTPGGPAIYRPNGSGSGMNALSRANDGVAWGVGTTGNSAASCQSVDVSGLIDFGRSSSGGSGTGTDLTYIPFAKDAVSFAWYSKNGTVGANTAFDTLSQAELNTIFTGSGSGTDITHSAVTVHITPCGIQAGSGTFNFWNTVTGATTTQEGTATTLCNGLITNSLSGRAEENSGDALKARGDALALVSGHANDEVIIGFSAGSYIARVNGAAPMVGANTVNLGSISDNGLTGTSQNTALGSPYSGTAPNLTPSTAFYNDGKFGRKLYVILPTTKATGAGNADIKSLFVGSTSQICNQSTTVQKFGFLPLASGCGDTALTRPYGTGQK
jgi:hypothetical protein